MSKLLQAGILIALGAFLAPSTAFSQSGAGYISGLLEDPNWCWKTESKATDPHGSGFYFYDDDPKSPGFHPKKELIVELSGGGTVEWYNGQPGIINPKRPTTRYVRVPCGPPSLTDRELIKLFLTFNWVETSSTTNITSPTDKQKIKYDPSQIMLSGRADIGSFFVTSQITFAGDPHGTFADVFPAFPAANFMATVNSGNVYSFNGDGGYTAFNSPDFSFGVFGGYYAFHEFLYGTFPGFAATFPLLSDQWSAGEGGVVLDKKFAVGAMPFDLRVTAAGLYDHLRAGAFSGNGGGARVNGMLSFPLGPVSGNIFAQYTDLNASSSNTGVPLQFRNENWSVGAGISYSFGSGPVASSAPMVFKAPSK